jgi:hypothetical protein
MVDMTFSKMTLNGIRHSGPEQNEVLCLKWHFANDTPLNDTQLSVIQQNEVF